PSIIAVGGELLAGGILIVGMGVDIAEVARIREAIEKRGEAFLRRLYTPRERAYCERFKNKYERYAGRFAAKEAAMKALGTGWSRGVRWVDVEVVRQSGGGATLAPHRGGAKTSPGVGDVEVVRQSGGRPTLALHGEAAKIAQGLNVENVALSITHTASQAFAQVIFE